jgi:ribosomal protein L11 methyltransferase
MYLRLTPQAAICSAWHPFWPRQETQLFRLRDARTFPISHPSTRLCLELLIGACRERRPASLLDVGCGSGILALAGAVLGVPFTVGCDLGAAAVQVSQDNARRGNLSQQVFWLRGSTEALQPAFHLIAANLPFSVQMAKRPELRRLVHPRGGLILSGFRDTREQELTEYYQSRGWRLQRRLTRDLWELELPEEKSYTWVGLYFVASDGF